MRYFLVLILAVTIMGLNGCDATEKPKPVESEGKSSVSVKEPSSQTKNTTNSNYGIERAQSIKPTLQDIPIEIPIVFDIETLRIYKYFEKLRKCGQINSQTSEMVCSENLQGVYPELWGDAPVPRHFITADKNNVDEDLNKIKHNISFIGTSKEFRIRDSGKLFADDTTRDLDKLFINMLLKNSAFGLSGDDGFPYTLGKESSQTQINRKISNLKTSYPEFVVNTPSIMDGTFHLIEGKSIMKQSYFTTNYKSSNCNNGSLAFAKMKVEYPSSYIREIFGNRGIAYVSICADEKPLSPKYNIFKVSKGN